MSYELLCGARYVLIVLIGLPCALGAHGDQRGRRPEGADTVGLKSAAMTEGFEPSMYVHPVHHRTNPYLIIKV